MCIQPILMKLTPTELPSDNLSHKKKKSVKILSGCEGITPSYIRQILWIESTEIMANKSYKSDAINQGGSFSKQREESEIAVHVEFQSTQFRTRIYQQNLHPNF